MHDLVIRGGTIVDGSGNPKYTGDVAINGNRLAQVGGKAGSAKEEIDASGAIVTPGWVDIHTHYDGQATWDPHLTPSGGHGVTTAIMGNCGVGFAPAAPDSHEWLINLMEGVEDIPGSALSEGITWGWESFPEYLDCIDKMERSIDIGAQIPHGALRAYVMGERGALNLVAEPKDISAMADIVEEALKAGALGFTSSRTMLHRALNGEPVPGTFAGADELMGIAKGVQKAGHGMFELATDFGLGSMSGRFSQDFDWMLDVASETGIPITYILGQADRAPSEWRDILAMTHSARANGHDIKALVAGRPAGMLLGLQSSLHPFQAHPTYMKFANLPLIERVAALSEPVNRATLLAEKSTFTGEFNKAFSSGFDKMFPLGDPPDYEPSPDKSVAAIAARQGRAANDVCLEFLLKNDGREMLYYPLLNYVDGDFEVLREMLEDDASVLSLSDGGAHCGLICDASMPSYLLTHWARDRTRGPRLGLEQVVKYQSRDTALSYGLADRGLLTQGLKADVNVIDFDNMRLHPPHMVNDLPANGQRLIQTAEGYLATIIAGIPSWKNGMITGAMPGKLIRGPQSG